MNTPTYTLAERQAIELYCAGDEAFFRTFKVSCRTQFRNDVQQGDRACAVSDWNTLRRVAHSIKGVLRSLGQPELAEHAGTVERNARAQLDQLAQQSWRQLCAGLAAVYGTTVEQL